MEFGGIDPVKATDPADSTAHWTRPIQVLHWATVALLAGLVMSGWGTNAHPSSSSLHLSLGILLFLVLLARIGARAASVSPALVTTHPALRRASKGVQLFLYGAMIAASVTGYGAVAPHPFMPEPMFLGWFELPRIGFDRQLVRASGQAHSLLVWAVLGAVAIHVAGVVWHVLFIDQGMIRRMLGSARTGPRS